MKILFSGGGTMGPVTPLLAVLRRMKEMDPSPGYAWAGTPDGPERDAVKQERVRFYEIPVAKIPRFVSPAWITFPFQYASARRVAKDILKKEKPNLVVSAGGFTSVPLFHEASRVGIPCATHQLDYVPGLSNKMMARWCSVITSSFPYRTDPFRHPLFPTPTERVPTPCRFARTSSDVSAGVRPGRTNSVKRKKDACVKLGLDPDANILFVFGGGTGASAVNEAILKIKKDLTAPSESTRTQILHLTGKGRGESGRESGYRAYPFFDENRMHDAYLAADLVVCRAGMGALSELACLKKAAILVPIPNSHQEKNAAAMPYPVVEQGNGFENRLLKKIREWMADAEKRERIGNAAHEALPTDDGAALAEKWLRVLK